MRKVFNESNVVYLSPEDKKRFSFKNQNAAGMLNRGGKFRILLFDRSSANPVLDLPYALIEVETDLDCVRIPFPVFCQMAGITSGKIPTHLSERTDLYAWWMSTFPDQFLGISYRNWQMDQPEYIPNAKTVLWEADPETGVPSMIVGYICRPCNIDRDNNQVKFRGTPDPINGVAIPVIILTGHNIFAYVNEYGAWCSAQNIYPRFETSLWAQAMSWLEFYQVNKQQGNIQNYVFSFPPN